MTSPGWRNTEFSEREFSIKQNKTETQQYENMEDYIVELPERSMENYTSNKRAISNSRKNKKLYKKENAIIVCYLTLPQTIFTRS